MLQVVVQKTPSGAQLAAIESPNPTPQRHEAVVEVHSISLNRGEVSAAFQRAEDGRRPGWDFAGTIVRAAADGSGLQAGTRVVGFLDSGAWAQQIAVDARSVAALPDSMSFETASTLPIAGLTALYALEKGGALLGKEVLITGATGGMGQFAVQLALLAGASVTAAVYRNALAAPADIRADRFRVVRTDTNGLSQLRERRYDLVVEGVGGEVFGAAVESLAAGGTIVTLGATRDVTASFNIRHFFKIGRARIYGFSIFNEVLDKPAAQGLATLMRFVQDGRLIVPLTYAGSVAEIDSIARDLMESKLPGKAVLRWNGEARGD